ncbi:MAG: hypothetical protein WC755_08955 [Candidatus Woesearchaeota archaeon]|jgi:hypothetical protein
MTLKEAFKILFKKKPKKIEDDILLSRGFIDRTPELLQECSEHLNANGYHTCVRMIPEKAEPVILQFEDDKVIQIDQNMVKIILEKYAPKVKESVQKPLNEKSASDIIDDLVDGGLI